jgi:proteasome accessory factor B
MMPQMDPLERLVNLVALLLSSQRPLTFEQIKETLSEGYGQGDPDTAKRMFERDKNILRDNGIPIEVVPTDAWDVEEGYTIPTDRYYLPEIEFTPQEISALYVAARSGGEDASAEQAVRKLLYGAEGGVLTASTPSSLSMGPDVDAARLNAVAEAVLAGSRRIRFGYTTSRGVSSQRAVDAYGLVWRAGHWYIVGLDRERGEIRAFRLSRMTSDVTDAGEGSEPPAGFRSAEHVDAGPWRTAHAEASVTVSLSPDVAWWAASGLRDAMVSEPGPDGWVRVTIPTPTDVSLGGWILSLGPDARVEDPPELREEILRRLDALRA